MLKQVGARNYLFSYVARPNDHNPIGEVVGDGLIASLGHDGGMSALALNKKIYNLPTDDTSVNSRPGMSTFALNKQFS